MADDDNFDIDIYGDDEPEQTQLVRQETGGNNGTNDDMDTTSNIENGTQTQDNGVAPKQEDSEMTPSANTHQDDTIDQQTRQEDGATPQAFDSRPTDAGATEAVIISELQWWVNDDDIRGWARYCGAEDELRDITFSEHKVNGKCKGQVYVDFYSPQSATAFYQLLQSDGSPNSAKPASKKFPVQYSNPSGNPFKTLPKDAPARQAAAQTPANTNAGAMRGVASNSPYERQAGFQRGRGGFRGGRGGYSQGMNGGYNNHAGGSFGRGGGLMGGFNRGGYQGGRGRGAFNQGNMNGGMMGMPNMMGMGGMMGMPNMMGMGGFNPMQGGGFNPAFFQGQQGGQGGDNPHGQKRMRQDG